MYLWFIHAFGAKRGSCIATCPDIRRNTAQISQVHVYYVPRKRNWREKRVPSESTTTNNCTNSNNHNMQSDECGQFCSNRNTVNKQHSRKKHVNEVQDSAR